MTVDKKAKYSKPDWEKEYASLLKENEDYKHAIETFESMAKEFKKENEELKEWKKSMLSVMPPIQEIGRAIGVKLGHSIHDKILLAIEELKKRVINLQQAYMTHEYNQAEAERVWPQVKQQIIDEAVEAKDREIAELKEALKKIDQMSDPGSAEAGIIYMKKVAHEALKLPQRVIEGL